MSDSDDDDLLTPAEVGRAFRVDAKTAARWAATGRFPSLPDGRPGAFRTLGGRWRFHRESVDKVRGGDEPHVT